MDLWKCRDPFEDRPKIFSRRLTTTNYVCVGATESTSIMRERVGMRFDPEPILTASKVNFPGGSKSDEPKRSQHKPERNVPSSSQLSEKTPGIRLVGPKYCAFCKKNGEVAKVFTSHTLKGVIDNRTVVVCPVLRRLKCDVCGATGDFAHTRTHCPESSNITPIAVLLKSTARKGNGKVRKVRGI